MARLRRTTAYRAAGQRRSLRRGEKRCRTPGSKEVVVACHWFLFRPTRAFEPLALPQMPVAGASTSEENGDSGQIESGARAVHQPCSDRFVPARFPTALGYGDSTR